MGKAMQSSLKFDTSGNAPELRCYVEADTDGQARQVLAWALDAARRQLGG